jgi:hypothetical protein
MKVGIRIERDDNGECTACEFTGAPPRTATHRTASRRSAAPRYTPQRNACSARRRWLSFLAAAQRCATQRCAPLRRATLRFAPHRTAPHRNATL